MARIRTVKPEFWNDEKLATLAPIDRLVFLGLICQADDYGRLVDNTKALDGLLFPLTDDTCEPSIETLARLSRVTRYRSASDQRLLQINGWDRHQKVDRPGKSLLPGPLEVTKTLASVSRDTRSPILDLRPTTMEQQQLVDELPSTPAKDAGGDAEKLKQQKLRRRNPFVDDCLLEWQRWTRNGTPPKPSMFNRLKGQYGEALVREILHGLATRREGGAPAPDGDPRAYLIAAVDGEAKRRAAGKGPSADPYVPDFAWKDKLHG